MRRWVTFFLVSALAVVVAWGVGQAPEALARLEAFRVGHVDFDGGRYLSRDEALEALALPSQASVWDDKEAWEARLREHPLVREATVRRRFPGTLILEIQEWEPVALYPNPTLEPVDEAGRFLPIDPALHRLDLPLMGSREGWEAGSLTPAERRLLAHEISRFAAGDPEFLARVSEITLGRGEDLQAHLWDPPFTLHFRPGLQSQRIQDGLLVLAHARAHFDGAEVVDLDLRYEDQVVIRMNRVEGN